MAQREEKKAQQSHPTGYSFLAQCWPCLQLLFWALPPSTHYPFQSCGLRGLGTEAGRCFSSLESP